MFTFAAYIQFYRGFELSDDGMVCMRGNEKYYVKDDKWVLEFYVSHKDSSIEELVHGVCTNLKMWNQDLTNIPEFEKTIVEMLKNINEYGMYKAMEQLG